ILQATGGQPFLTACVFDEVRKEELQQVDEVSPLINRLTEKAKDGHWLKAHFENPKNIIMEQPSRAYPVLDQYLKVLEKPVATGTMRDDIRAALLSSGLVKETNKSIVVKSPIYRDYFDQKWIDDLKQRIGNSAFAGDRIVVQDTEKKDRICIINTGGMISMELQPDGKLDQPHDVNLFFRRFPELHTIAEIDSVTIMGKDSSDVNPGDWKRIAEAIYQRRSDGYNGFV
ncbi:MAG: hypothetical protein GY761_18530, partial [Hyphomicrobiales bacterium]|nr:hypothetical protein [Hyphomicrobiales bacterium]